jgi:hypothetical protein
MRRVASYSYWLTNLTPWGAMIAMRLLIDMDGVVADFLGHWCKVFNER